MAVEFAGNLDKDHDVLVSKLPAPGRRKPASLERDHVSGASFQRAHTFVLALTGQRDEALERIAANIDAPEGFSRWELYLEPEWDFFRNDERFNELVRPEGVP